MSGAPDLLAAALHAHAAGLCAWPPREDGTKAPILEDGKWKHRQRERTSEAELRALYANGRTGLGLVCGAVSNGLELFECEDRETWHAFQARAEDAGLSHVLARVEQGYLEEPPRGGVHLLYYCDAPRSTKLAQREKAPEERRDPHDKIATLIETKGEGGYVIVAPSHGGVHPSGRPYRLVRGGFESIVRLTPDEREALHELARTFEELGREKAERTSTPPPGEAKGTRPGDDFNARTTWPELLEPAGWARAFESGGLTYWRRPGKAQGISATAGLRGDTDLLWVFTSSSIFESERGYDKFGAYAVLHHGGDLAAAARELGARGFGAPPRAGGPAESGPGEREGFALTDYGNGERLAARHGPDLRYVFAWSRWLVWDGVRFAPDDQGEAWRRAKDTARAIYAEAAAAEGADERKRIATWAKTSESEVRLRAMLELAKSEPGIPVRHDALDAAPWLLAVQNGVVDLRTGKLRAASRADLLTKLAPVAFDPSAKAPTWGAFLERIIPDQAVRDWLQRAVGYSLTGETREHALFLLHGTGANGKSTFMETLLALLGDYALKTPAETLLARRDTGVPNDVARMRGARLVAACETEDGRRLAEVRVKELTGGDTVSARFMRAEWFDFRPVAKLWLSTNHRPSVRGTDEGIWRRLRLVPFAVVIPEAERDRTLPERLRAELPGVLAWALEGCRAWLRDGLQEPEAVREATSAYRDAEDVLAAFLEERCALNEGCWTASKQLYDAYRDWCEATGEKSVTQKRLGDSLRERGFESSREGHARTRGWSGIGLKVTP